LNILYNYIEYINNLISIFYNILGLSGAIAYYCYQYMTRNQLAILNTIIPLISIICYILSDYIHSQEYDVISNVSSELSVNINKN
jgi:hypothetical protein